MPAFQHRQIRIDLALGLLSLRERVCIMTPLRGAAAEDAYVHMILANPGEGAEKKLKANIQSFWPTLKELGLAEGASIDNYEFVGSSLGKRSAENAPERPDIKSKLLAELDNGTRPDVVIASSSSSIPSSQFIDQCQHPERVLIGHPFNPPHLMPLVEIVPHPKTSQTAIETTRMFYASIGRRSIVVKQEIPGFVANRLQAALLNEAYSLVSRGILSAEDLDAAVTPSLGPRWATVGPFMANAMGGGGGSDGFRHLLEHLGPYSQKWVDDMREHAFAMTTENIDSLTRSVDEKLQGKNVKELEAERDAKLVELFERKGKQQ
ncbi:3-hydroxyacyl-CoA dehydrogenase like protein [Zymoseptoria brevis]|uniref:3-hydroxyacyl-CoA dehydrogenase like protein n=1 Tax=Zymoseptoria brevis TaxID=1047168 RepID=A0A0F4GK31_9PEZI|nr:3-hydroxyacyl-CoA dehydrogenase like protein [Zymoseptoria brevis]